jgi:hypothetical protein
MADPEMIDDRSESKQLKTKHIDVKIKAKTISSSAMQGNLIRKADAERSPGSNEILDKK